MLIILKMIIASYHNLPLKKEKWSLPPILWVEVTIATFLDVVATIDVLNPFSPGDFAEKRALKLVEQFSDHCGAIKS